MIKFGLPTLDMLEGDNKLSFIDKIGINSAITDFGYEQGGVRYKNYIDSDNGRYLDENRSSKYFFINKEKNVFGSRIMEQELSSPVRPIMFYEDISELGNAVEYEDNVATVTYGEYLSKKLSSDIINYYQERIKGGKMLKTGKIFHYPFDNRVYRDDLKNELVEYYDVESQTKIAELSGNPPKCFFVDKIKWYVDEERHICLSEKSLTGAIYANRNYSFYLPDNINDSCVYQFLNGDFARDIVPTDIFLKKQQDLENEKKNAFTNPWEFDEEQEIKDVMDEIKAAVDADVPVFIHGLFGDGKTDRVYQIDPNAYRISLSTWSYKRLNGVTTLVTDDKGQHSKEEKPAWLNEFEKICNETPDKIHILFLDELTNVEGEMQKCALDLALEKKLQGIWKLPINSRIVAAGNEVEDSLYASTMPAPLFTRFVHCYVKTTKTDWLLWASEHDIHPAIYTFVACYGDEVLRDEFDGKNAIPTPRTWKMASDILKKNKNPFIIKSAVGEKVTNKFIEFIKNTRNIITPKAVLNNLYDINEIKKLTIAQKYATIMAVTNVDIDNLEIIRNFVIELSEGNGELLKVFEDFWVHGNELRKEQLEQLKVESLLKRGLL